MLLGIMFAPTTLFLYPLGMCNCHSARTNMSISNVLQSCFQVVTTDNTDGSLWPKTSGSAVAVFRDSKTSDLYLATTKMVGDGVFYTSSHTYQVIDAWNRRYTDVKRACFDFGLNISILRVSGVPKTVPVALISNSVAAGDNVYVVGMPFKLNSMSVTRGTISWPTWSHNTEHHVSVNAPMFGGNEGSGVFNATTHKLVGIASWLEAETTLLIPAVTVYKAMLAVQYEARPIGWRFAVNRYCPGGLEYSYDLFHGLLLSTEEFARYRPQNQPLLSDLGRAGMQVIRIPGDDIQNAFYYNDGSIRNADIIWALALPPKSAQQSPNWYVVSKDQPFMSLVSKLDAMRDENKNRKPLPWRSSVSDVYLSVARPATPTFPVRALVSGIVEGAPDNVFRQVTIELKPVSDTWLHTTTIGSGPSNDVIESLRSLPTAIKERMKVSFESSI